MRQWRRRDSLVVGPVWHGRARRTAPHEQAAKKGGCNGNARECGSDITHCFLHIHMITDRHVGMHQLRSPGLPGRRDIFSPASRSITRPGRRAKSTRSASGTGPLTRSANYCRRVRRLSYGLFRCSFLPQSANPKLSTTCSRAAPETACPKPGPAPSLTVAPAQLCSFSTGGSAKAVPAWTAAAAIAITRTTARRAVRCISSPKWLNACAQRWSMQPVAAPTLGPVGTRPRDGDR
jgi:hypothetical protein